MGQVVTLMPLLHQTIIVEEDSQFLNQVGGKSGYTSRGGAIAGATQMPSSLPTKPKPTGTSIGNQPSGNLGGGSSASGIGGSSISNQPSGNLGGGIQQPNLGSGSGSGSGSDSGSDSGSGSADFGFNIPNWDILSCSQVASEVERLKNIRLQKVYRPAAANELLDSNIAIGNSILQYECQYTGTSGDGFGGGEFGLGNFGGFGASGFGASGFGDNGDFQQPSAEDYEVLGYDKLGCPIYGYDENGTPLYGIDMNGNIITDPTVLPCGMKAMQQRGENPIKQVAKDITFRVSVLVLGGMALITLLNKNKQTIKLK